MSHPAELLTPSCCRACSNLDVPLPCVRGLGLPCDTIWCRQGNVWGSNMRLCILKCTFASAQKEVSQTPDKRPCC